MEQYNLQGTTLLQSLPTPEFLSPEKFKEEVEKGA
jgi:hypothetical protein